MVLWWYIVVIGGVVVAVSNDNLQCTTYLNKEVAKVVDNLAKANMRTRSTEIAYMVHEYLKSKGLLPKDN